MKVAIIDYGMGNLYSVQSALDYIGCESVISFDPLVLRQASHIVLPGVGSFRSAMEKLEERKLILLLSELVELGVPLLGICLGMQLLANKGDEDGGALGLGFIEAEVTKFERNNQLVKIPHVGFNEVKLEANSQIYDGINCGSDFYFTHSYKMECDKKFVTGTCVNGVEFNCSVQKNNVFGVQFHPEKSQANGLKLLVNFLRCSKC